MDASAASGPPAANPALGFAGRYVFAFGNRLSFGRSCELSFVLPPTGRCA